MRNIDNGELLPKKATTNTIQIDGCSVTRCGENCTISKGGQKSRLSKRAHARHRCYFYSVVTVIRNTLADVAIEFLVRLQLFTADARHEQLTTLERGFLCCRTSPIIYSSQHVCVTWTIDSLSSSIMGSDWLDTVGERGNDSLCFRLSLSSPSSCSLDRRRLNSVLSLRDLKSDCFFA